jgi:hypothetical protein
MHLYYRDIKRLEKVLRKFAGGQFLMEATGGLVFRGKINNCVVPTDQGRRIFIHFDWLCERRLVLEEWPKLTPKWFLLEPTVGHSYLDVGFTSYYPQPDEGRLKMWGEFGEVCRFFRRSDYTNLVKNEEQFVPYGQLHQEKLCQVMLFLLWQKKLPQLSQLMLSAFLHKKQQPSQQPKLAAYFS